MRILVFESCLTVASTERRQTGTRSSIEFILVDLFVVLLAAKHTNENLSDRLELGRVDEWIGAHV